ncbi:MAG: GGDEF domain-containing protein [Amphritea sp.]|nr:GGDEF domain-containing protein [Amphritea sp.]
MSDQNFFAKHLLQLVINIGRIRSVLLITMISVAISLLITWLCVRFLASSQHNMTLSLLIATAVPLIAAPATSWPLMGLFLKVHRLEAEMRRLALTDPLTSLANRRYFLEQAENYLALARRSQHPVSVIMLDIDHFKRINDSYGHATGDKVLQLFSESLRQLCRESDAVGRLGGEEFAILLPDSDAQAAAQFCQRLHQQTSELEHQQDNQVIHFTVSAGIKAIDPADITTDTISLDRLLNEADKALYRAKEAGRNQTRIA